MDKKTLKIGIDASSLSKKHPAGPERYLYSLIKALSKIDYRNTYYLYTVKNTKVPHLEEICKLNPHFIIKPVPRVFSWRHLSLSLDLLLHKTDIFFSSNHTLPILSPLTQKNVSMIHGIDLKYGEERSNILRSMIIRLLLRYCIYFSDSLIVPSYFVKNQVNTFASNKNSKIEVIYEGIDLEKYKIESQGLNSSVLDTYNVEKETYFLFVSTVQPRKNIPNLIEGFCQALKHPSFATFKLLIVGRLGWDFEDIVKLPSKYRAEKSIKFLGWIKDEELMSLLSSAKAYINVSNEEGFGLTPFEAAAFKTPLILSDIDTFKELLKDGAYFVNPKNIDEIKETLLMLANPSEEAKDNIEEKKTKAFELAKSLSWEETATRTLRIFEETVKTI